MGVFCLYVVGVVEWWKNVYRREKAGFCGRVWRVPDCQSGAVVDGCKVKPQVVWQCRAKAQRSTSPKLALHCMRMRALRVDGTGALVSDCTCHKYLLY